MPILDSGNRDTLFPVGASAVIIARWHGTSYTATKATVQEHLKNGVKVVDAQGEVRRFGLYGYEHGYAKEWHKPYLYDATEGAEMEARYIAINAKKVKAGRRLEQLAVLRTAASRQDDEAFREALAQLNTDEEK